MKKWSIAVLFLLLILILLLILTSVYLGYKSKAGFRGGSEAIGGRTGGTAYSGAAAELDPDMS